MRPHHDLRVAIGFLTRVPVGDVSNGDPSSVRLASAVPWFPLVGAAVGLVQGLAWLGLAEVVSPLLAAALATAVALLITGAFHHDGLADMADAFGGGWTVEQRFEILKDSRLGTYGTAALGLALLIEVAAIADVGAADPFDALGAIVTAHAVARCAALIAMLAAPVAGDGLGASYMRDLSPVAVGIGIGAGVVVAALASPVLIVGPLIGAAIAGLLVVALSVRKIGGVTGDVLGAIVVCTLLASLIVTAALL